MIPSATPNVGAAMPHVDARCAPFARYARQMRFAPLGEEGQRRLGESAALLCGCGAVGSAIANTLVRAGIGRLRIVDRDFVELGNLHRQSLFDEADAAAKTPKAVAAAEKLRAVNSEVAVEPFVADLGPTNVARFCDGVQIILDGLDNFETRMLVNDAAVKLRIPWVYGGCVGAEGRSMTIMPGETACLRCLMPECPAPGATDTCETAGIVGPAVALVAAIEAAEALKILSGRRDDVSRGLMVVDLWHNEFRRIDLAGLRERADCPTCARGEYPWLSGRAMSRSASLCGRNAVQISRLDASVSLDELAERLAEVGRVTRNEFFVQLEVEGYEITVFADARAVVAGTDDIPTARALIAKYIGS